MVHTRDKVPQQDQWDLTPLYPSFEEWKKAFSSVFVTHEKIHWPELNTFKGKLHENPTVLKECLDYVLKVARALEKLYTYIHLKHDENIADDAHKAALNLTLAALHAFSQETAWFEPELLALPKENLDRFINSSILESYRFHLEKIIRMKEHTLSKENEQLLALAGKSLETSQKAFSAITDADFSFGSVTDGKGEMHEITHASYGLFIRDQDRILRKNSFKQYHALYKNYENTLAELLSGQVEAHLFQAKARRYTNALESALFPHQIDTQVYTSLIQTVNENLPVLHKYIALRKKILGYQELHLYDMYVPLTSEFQISFSFEEAASVLIESTAPLGAFYQTTLERGLFKEHWVDRYENKHKRSGAYSSGCYDSHPYILMNYKNQIRDVFTLAHEAGHSMHSLLSRQKQPFHYNQYPIFLAEVASTFNEDLLTRYLLKRSQNKQEKIFLINQQIEDIRSTLFRQTLFAEFEWAIHSFAEQHIPLTPSLLKETFFNLNKKYFGSDVCVDPEIEIEWARIPHFYYNFYVYQYATGISAALSLTEKVFEGGEKEQKAYLDFLSGGGSDYPIAQLKKAGVDMTSKEPIQLAIQKFHLLVDQLERFINCCSD